MHIQSIRLVGIRCFEDTRHIALSSRCNIFVGQNNTGKSTLLRGVLVAQGFPFGGADVRQTSTSSFAEMFVTGISPTAQLNQRPGGSWENLQVVRLLKGNGPEAPGHFPQVGVSDPGIFPASHPNNTLVPFLARRKAPQFDHNVTLGHQQQLSGTFSNLYSRIDLVATAGHPRHTEFQNAVREIVGLPITTRASTAGKEAGFYLDDNDFVTLDRMGDGVTEMVALIVELCLARNKIFVLEEPETNLHPKGLKALLSMVRASSTDNQFIIATHSNIVVRELAFDAATKVFRVYRDDQDPRSPSGVEEVPKTPAAHTAVLRELGYEFTDLGLHDGWLFLEESSAERIIRDILIPKFAPALEGRLRTYSAGGASNVEPSIAEFQRLVTFIHLQPAYEGRLWVRVDDDAPGRAAVSALRTKFPYLTDQTCATFGRPAFEHYYPSHFAARIEDVLNITDKRARRVAKVQLLDEVVAWTKTKGQAATDAWETSAAEPIAVLRAIQNVIV